jgi:hypothetical protein
MPGPKRLSLRALREETERRDLELNLQAMEHQEILLRRMTLQENRLALQDADESDWIKMSHGGAILTSKDLPEINRDPAQIRRLSYRMWRFNPHARGIIRNFEKFIIGREFGLDFSDQTKGKWNPKRTKLVRIKDEPPEPAPEPMTFGGYGQANGGGFGDEEEEDEPEPREPKPKKSEIPTMVRELWDDFAKMNKFNQLMKEMVRRSFRDAGAFIRKFEVNGYVFLRFVEPDLIVSPTALKEGAVQAGDLGPEWDRVYGEKNADLVGQPTTIKDGVEFLTDDPVLIVAYWIAKSVKEQQKPERVPMADMAVTRPFADANDPTGILLLEVVMKTISNYTTWEEYRMLLNKFRSAIVLHRKVEGTAIQAQNIIAGRASPRQAPLGRGEPNTTSGRREAMPAGGSIITSPPGVDWEYKRPNLDAADAEHDGRRMLLTAAAGVGLPEGIVTSDWSNNSYASSVESRTPAVREWEDWQEFFEAPILRIVEWVLDSGVENFGLPKDIDRKVTIQWPPLVTKDADKETNRNAMLHERGVLSLTTWSAREDLVLEDEIENMRQEAELTGRPGPGLTPPAPPPPGGGGGFGGGGEGEGGGSPFGGFFGEATETEMEPATEIDYFGQEIIEGVGPTHRSHNGNGH